MARLIDAEALMEELKGFRNESKVAYRALLTKLIYFVAAMPPVDAQPVVHGEWTICEDDYHDETIYTCSVCKEDFVTIDGTPAQNLWNYCPNCGAKMN